MHAPPSPSATSTTWKPFIPAPLLVVDGTWMVKRRVTILVLLRVSSLSSRSSWHSSCFSFWRFDNDSYQMSILWHSALSATMDHRTQNPAVQFKLTRDPTSSISLWICSPVQQINASLIGTKLPTKIDNRAKHAHNCVWNDCILLEISIFSHS